MKILLLGEYSGVFNSLAKALRNDGHEVLLINDGDSYKSFNADIYIKYNYLESNNKYIKKLINTYYTLLMYSGFKGCIQIFKYKKTIKNMKDYDVVQLVNPVFLSDYGTIVNLFVFKYLKKNNKKVFLSALGDDYVWVKYCLDNKFEYSIFDRLSFTSLKNYVYPLYYVYGFMNPFLNKYIVKNVNAIIPGLYDYYAAYKGLENCTEIVPLIMCVDKDFTPKDVVFPLKVFHGWQLGKELRKGNDLFDRAFKRIQKDYPDKIEYKVVSGLTYEEYIKKFDDSHIFIDQCYSQDSGVNALLGMKEGKVVFSGFERVVQEYYGLQDTPIINSIPNEEKIYEDIKNLILNPNKVKDLSLKAVDFVKKFHNESYVLDKYLAIWEKR